MADAKLIYEIITDCWKLYKENPAQEEQIYWSDLCDKAAQINDKYNHPFCDDMVQLIIRQLERDIENE